MRRFCILAVSAAILALGPLLWAGEIVGPEQVDPYKLIDCSVSGDWEAAIWEIEGPHAADMRTGENGMKVTWVAPPGKYIVRCVLVHFENKRLSQEKLEVVIGTPEPEPDPNPIPPPPPEPGKRWVIVIEESSERTPQFASVVVDARNVWRGYVKSSGHQFRLWDKDVVPADGVSYRERCKTFPTMFIADTEGTILYEGEPPTSSAQMLALIKEYGG